MDHLSGHLFDELPIRRAPLGGELHESRDQVLVEQRLRCDGHRNVLRHEYVVDLQAWMLSALSCDAALAILTLFDGGANLRLANQVFGAGLRHVRQRLLEYEFRVVPVMPDATAPCKSLGTNGVPHRTSLGVPARPRFLTPSRKPPALPEWLHWALPFRRAFLPTNERCRFPR